MSEVTVKITGMEEIKKRLDDLQDGRLARSFMRSGARKAAQVLAKGQKQTVPFEHGDLSDSIGVQVKNANTDNLRVLVGPDRKYNFIGRFHEFGTKFVPAQHWMQKAFDNTVHEALAAFTNEVRRKLNVYDYKALKAQQAASDSE